MLNGKRTHGIIDELPAELKDVVNSMLEIRQIKYTDIIDFLAQNDVKISQASVSRYAQRYNASMEALQVAQENSIRMMAEINKYPDLDTTEAIIRLTSQNVFNALANTKDEDWQTVDIDKLLRESTSLIRATAYKKRIDIQNKDKLVAGLDEVKSLVFESMAKERPELYKQVAEFLNSKKEGL